MTVQTRRNQAGRRMGVLDVTRGDAGQRLTVAVIAAGDNGIRIELRLGADGRTVYLEAYHWFGHRQPIKIVSTTTGEPIDTQQPADRPHPELAIVEDGELAPPPPPVTARWP